MAQSFAGKPVPGKPIPGKPLAGIILAAGQASRFGSDKRLALGRGGLPLLVNAISLVRQCCAPTLIALKPGDENQLPSLLGPHFETAKPLKEARPGDDLLWFIAPRAEQGMGSTLADAVNALEESGSRRGQVIDGVAIMLADLPRLQLGTLLKLKAALTKEAIVVPVLENCSRSDSPEQDPSRWGNPVLFGREWFGDLRRISGEKGARPLVVNNPAACCFVSVADLGILQDVDYPEQLKT